MARIPLEDNYTDVLHKAQRGLNVTDKQLAARADVSEDALKALKAGTFSEVVARRVAPHLQLSRDALIELAAKKWYPEHPVFSRGFAIFNTRYEDMTVNSYVIWDERTKLAAIFDTGATADPILDLLKQEKLHARYIFLTHTHEDHIADLPRLARETSAEVWSSELEPSEIPQAKTFSENAFFHLGQFSVKTLLTNGHSPGGTSFHITGLSFPLVLVGDSMFSASMGGTPPSEYLNAVNNNRTKILSLSVDTAIGCGHGPMSTVGQEKKHNPFFAR